MSSTQNTLIAGVVVALIIGVAIGYFVYPSMNPQTPGEEWVSKSSYDQLQSQYQAAQADLSDAQAEIAELTAPKKVGLILATGGLGDKSFNDISYAGCMRAKEELGVDFDYVESSAIAEYEGYQRDFASSGEYMLIICIGFDQAPALTIVAAEYPEQNFALVDMVVDNPNVASLTFRANEGSFLVGVVAGMVTETDKVGFVGGQDIPLIRDFFEGYEAGAIWANSEVTVSDPVFVGDWADPIKGKELSLALIEQDNDCIYSAAGKSGLGALEGAHEEGVYTFGVDACQCHLYDEIIASMTKRVDVAVYKMILDALIGKFQGGFYSGGVAEGWIGLCRLPEEEPLWEETFDFEHLELPDEVINKVTEAKNAIVAGDITVPTGYD
jgi:basic membrane protein A